MPAKLATAPYSARLNSRTPGGSIKDRAAKSILTEAHARGELARGGLVVEGTAGNTGVGLALIGRALQLNTLIVMPDNQSREKKTILKNCGAELVLVAPAPYSDPNNFVRVAERIAADKQKLGINAFWARQFDNTDNRLGHYADTAPEIFEQTQGTLDGFVCACGTGGTLAGCSLFFRARNPDIKIGLADPSGASLDNYYRHGELMASEGESMAEGIGQSRVTQNLEGFTPDFSWVISDAEALEFTYRLLYQEGICVGLSSGINIAGAVRLARELGPGKTIATILCDSGFRYADKLFDEDMLREKNLPRPSQFKETGWAS